MIRKLLQELRNRKRFKAIMKQNEALRQSLLRKEKKNDRETKEKTFIAVPTTER